MKRLVEDLHVFLCPILFFLVADANKYIWNSITKEVTTGHFVGLLSFQM